MESPLEILQELYIVRVRLFEKRKAFLIEKLSDEWSKFDNKCRFIKAVIDGHLVISNRKKNDLLNDLKRMNFRSFIPASLLKDKSLAALDRMDEEEDHFHTSIGTSDLDKGYEYLLGMKIWSLTQEKVAELMAQRDEKRRELEVHSYTFIYI